jgi:hypothetical protein
MTMDQTLSDQPFDAAAAGRQIDAVFEKRETAAKKTKDYADTLKQLLVEAKRNVPDFKAFIKEHTQIGYSTAKRILAIADGRGEEIRAQERENKQKQRAAKAGTTAVPASDSTVVKLGNGEALKSLDGFSEAAKRQIAAAGDGSADQRKAEYAVDEAATTGEPVPTPNADLAAAVDALTGEPPEPEPAPLTADEISDGVLLEWKAYTAKAFKVLTEADHAKARTWFSRFEYQSHTKRREAA